MPSASFDDKKKSDFLGGEFRGAWDAHGVDAWGGREWTPRAEGGAGTSRTGPWVGGCGFGRGWGVGRGRRRARPRQARPSHVVEGAGDARFHIGTVPPGRYAARRRAKYPRRPRHGTSKQGPAQGPAATSAALPCGRGCRGRGISRRSSSEVKSRIPKPAAGGPQLLRPTRFDCRGDDAFQITILVMNKILLRIEISRLAPHVRGGVAVHFPVRRVVPGGGAPVWRDALNCVPPVAAI